jgi:deazaflavin-dependent oxidoreductase (nitroreductase family)
VVVASNGGSPRHPDWYHNLKANPAATVEVGNQIIAMLAREVDDPERAALWSEVVAAAPQVANFQAGVTRRIPVLRLRPST